MQSKASRRFCRTPYDDDGTVVLINIVIVAVAVLVLVPNGPMPGVAEAAQIVAAADCHEVQECQRLALEARLIRGAYETFHDLPGGPCRPAAGMIPSCCICSRGHRACSNRPTDALVTLKRLAEGAWPTTRTRTKIYGRSARFQAGRWSLPSSRAGRCPRGREPPDDTASDLSCSSS